MLEKKLPPVAASLLLTANVSAITIGPGDNAIVIFNTAGHGSYLIDTGKSADLLIQNRQEAGFRINIEAAATALGGTIEEFVLIGLPTQISGVAQVDGYFDPGILYSGLINSSASSVNHIRTSWDLKNAKTTLIEDYFNGANFGLNPEGSSGDIDNSMALANQFGEDYSLRSLNTGSEYSYRGDASVIFSYTQYDIGSLTSVGGLWVDEARYPQHECPNGDPYAPTPYPFDPLDCSLYTSTGFSLNGNTFGFGAVPVPGAAWLFGSALLGLGSFKKRQASSKQ